VRCWEVLVEGDKRGGRHRGRTGRGKMIHREDNTTRDECNKKKLTLRKAEEGASPLTWAWAAMVEVGGSAWGISLVTLDKMEISPTGVSAYLSTRTKQETDEGNRSCSMTTRNEDGREEFHQAPQRGGLLISPAQSATPTSINHNRSINLHVQARLGSGREQVRDGGPGICATGVNACRESRPRALGASGPRSPKVSVEYLRKGQGSYGYKTPHQRGGLPLACESAGQQRFVYIKQKAKVDRGSSAR
jgi:hypothetical protein